LKITVSAFLSIAYVNILGGGAVQPGVPCFVLVKRIG
jgi:hypothetical protein